jgi:heptosyltransferase-2
MKRWARRTLLKVLNGVNGGNVAACTVEDLRKSRRILVARFDEMGDLVLCTPFLRELRRFQPEALIVLLVKPAIANLMELCPYINSVVPFQPRFGLRPDRLAALWALRRHVQAALGGRPDMGILPRYDADFSRGLITLLAVGARHRVGFTELATEEKSNADSGTDQYLSMAISLDAPGSLAHEVERNLSLLAALGARVESKNLELWLSDADRSTARQILAQCPDVVLWIGLCPGASSPRKRWPSERYASVVAHLVQVHKSYGVVVVGSSDDAAAGDEICRAGGARCINAAGKLTVRQTAAVLARCRLYLGNDTGPMHLAAAAGVPVVAVYADSLACGPLEGTRAAARFGPWGVPHRLLPAQAVAPCTDRCRENHAHCILTVPEDAVVRAVENILLCGNPQIN